MRALFLVGCATGLLFLAGCGGGDDGGTGSGSSSTAGKTGGGKTTPPTPAAEDTTAVAYAELADAGETGSLKGRIVFDGTPAEAARLEVNKDQEFCGKHDLRDESLVVGDGGGIANAVVSLYLKRGADAPEAEAGAGSVELNNVNCRFEPHVCVVQVGQELVIGNKDTVGHNTKIDLGVNPPLNPTVTAGASITESFSAAERLPAKVSCSIHPWMAGYLIVADHPFVAVTGANGEFEIANLPAGEWTFQLWHEKLDTDAVSRDGTAVEWKKGRFTVEIKAGSVADLGDVKVAG